MADATITVSINASKGGASVNSVGTTGAAATSYTMTGTDMGSGTTLVSTTTATLSVGSATGPYWLFVRNTSSTSGETIRIGNANADPITSLRTTIEPGESNLISVESGGTVYVEAAAGTASTPVLFWVAVEK
jgi:hypothetical protein